MRILMATADRRTELPAGLGEAAGQGPWLHSLVAARGKVNEGVAARLAIGSVPPGPPTLRARIGALLIHRIRRMLFWLLPQLDRFHLAVIEIEQQQVRVAEELAAAQRSSAMRIQALEEEVGRHRAFERSLRQMESGARGARARLDDLEERLQWQAEDLPAQGEGLRAEVAGVVPVAVVQTRMPRATLQALVEILKDHSLGFPHMSVLDVGSGNGEWLKVIESAGFSAQGVEADCVLAAAGGSRGLRMVAADPLAYLKSLAPCSMAAVTALNAIEHLSVARCTMLLDETFRVLQPGGIAIFAVCDSSLAGGCAGEQSTGALSALARARGFGDPRLVCAPADGAASAELNSAAGVSLRDDRTADGLCLACLKPQSIPRDSGRS